MITKIKNIKNPLLLFKNTIELKPGINLLGGGNGVGKTTLLREIKQWAQSKGYWESSERFANLFSNKEETMATAAKHLNIQVESDEKTSRCIFWQNAKDNHRYVKPDFFSPKMDQIQQYYDAGERSEGENVVVSFLSWLDQLQIQDTDVLLVDEIDSGLSVDACNGIMGAMLATAKKTGCQFIVTCNNFHFPYVCGEMINLLDGETVNFFSSYTKFCDFSYANARKLGPIRDKAREKARKEQLAWAKKEERRKKKEREARLLPYQRRRQRSEPATPEKEEEPSVAEAKKIEKESYAMLKKYTSRREVPRSDKCW